MGLRSGVRRLSIGIFGSFPSAGINRIRFEGTALSRRSVKEASQTHARSPLRKASNDSGNVRPVNWIVFLECGVGYYLLACAANSRKVLTLAGSIGLGMKC